MAFSALQLQFSLTCPFFLDYAQRVLVEGYSLHTDFKALLTATSQSNFARHTNLMYFQRQAGSLKLEVSEFNFSHPTFRPWGFRIPASCPECKSPRSWGKPIKQGSSIIFVCHRTGCKGICRFGKPEGIQLLDTNVNGGRWMVKKYLV